MYYTYFLETLNQTLIIFIILIQILYGSAVKGRNQGSSLARLILCLPACKITLANVIKLPQSTTKTVAEKKLRFISLTVSATNNE